MARILKFLGGHVRIKTKIVLAGAFLLSSLAAAEVPVPDTSYKHNVLPNGLTYYVKKNAFPEKRASIRLFVRAGSIHEEDQQQGLAHFLEHMLFRGSENFADWEVINFLESIGAQFGPDTNAFTSFDRTCYMLELPLEKEEVLEKAFHICSDWANKATISNELVEKERSVVCDEYNLSMKNCSTRQFKKISDTFLSNSIFGKRWPIGKKDIILNCDPQEIRDFYKKWYRPDRMAVVAVGDFDEDEVEAFIIKYFSGIEKPEVDVEDPDTSMNYPEDSIFEVFQDDEQSANIGMFWSFIDNEDKDESDDGMITETGMKKAVFKSIFARVLAKRLDFLTKKHPAPFAFHFPMNLDISRIGIRGLGYCPFEDRPYEGLTEIMREMSRLFTFGPSEHEFKDVAVTLRNEVEEALANTHRTTHATLAEDFIEHYMNHYAVYTTDDRLSYKVSIFDEVTREQMIEWLKENDFEPFRHIVFEVSDANFVSKDQIVATVEEWMQEEVVDVEQAIVQDFASEKTKVENAEYTKTYDEQLGFTKVVLKNGMEIVLQPSDLEKKAVTLEYIAKGGKSLLSDDLLPTSDYVMEYVKEAGIGNLAGHQYISYMQKKNISNSCTLGLNSRTIVWTGTNENLDTMLSMSKSLFSDRIRDKDAWDAMIARHSEVYKNLEKNPYHYFTDFVTKHYHDQHPMYMRYKPWEAKEESAITIANQLFSDPSEYKLVVIGDFDVDEILPHIIDLFHDDQSDKEQKLAIRSDKNSPDIAEEDITIYRGEESHCLNYLFYGKQFNYEHLHDMSMTYSAFDHLLTHRLLEKLRREMGDTYSVHLSSQFPLGPDLNEMIMVITFGCEPEKADNMKKIVRGEIDAFLKTGVTDEEIKTAKQILAERMRVSFLSNQGLLNVHVTNALYGTDVHRLSDCTSRIDRQVTKERIEAYAQAAFTEDRYLSAYTIKPESVQE